MSDFIDIKADKSLKNKIKSELNSYSDKFYWNIKFNIPLQMETVNSETTNVTNEYGDLLQAKVFYLPFDNLIVIEPHDKYSDDVFYFLNVYTGVCSENGAHLKEEIHIRFKLKNKKIAEIKTFKGEIAFKALPLSIRFNLPYIKLSSKYSISEKKSEYDFKMPYLIMPYFMLPFVLCILVFLGMPGYLSYLVGFPICIALTIVQIIILVLQYMSTRQKAIHMHNKGVTHFNKRELLDALDCFKRAYDLDNTNQYTKSAILKVNKYLT